LSSVMTATGRRKTSTAKVWVKSGSGKFTVNGKELNVFFNRDVHIAQIMQPLEATSNIGKYDIDCSVLGGGQTGQAGAIRMGIARALSKADEAMKVILAKGGFLTRDSRMVERKKYGRMKARRRYQFSKR